MTEREKIFARIREALTVKAPMPGHHDVSGKHAPATNPPSAQARQWLPAAGGTFEEQLARFGANAADLKIEFHMASDIGELSALLLKLRDAEGWKKIASHAGELTDAVDENGLLEDL